uniref:Uncharacterized protein n=1 Tax=Guillardia theta TaxID=55529 RepID=A0A7S4NXC9_GUITH|mmetsp:Transcript_37550/g.118451  ORF Transcript_37550/g.118451 Transcript_37550/m.118451 type:complete len:129 (+) Transcript_37550:55-441(+)
MADWSPKEGWFPLTRVQQERIWKDIIRKDENFSRQRQREAEKLKSDKMSMREHRVRDPILRVDDIWRKQLTKGTSSEAPHPPSSALAQMPTAELAKLQEQVEEEMGRRRWRAAVAKLDTEKLTALCVP